MKRVIKLIIFLISLSSVVSLASEDIILGDSLKKLDNYFETLQNELESKLKEESCFYCKTDQETLITYQKKQFSYFIQSFPKPIAYKIERALKEGKSLDEIKSLYHQEVENYLKTYLDFNRELSLYIEKKIRKHGPMVHDQIDLKKYQQKAKEVNLESQIVYDTLQDVTEVILKDAFQWILKHNHLSLKEMLHKVDLRRKLYDGFTIQVIYIASKYFRSEGIYAKSFDEEKILTKLTDKAASRGINASQVRSLWEHIKGFHLEALTFMI